MMVLIKPRTSQKKAISLGLRFWKYDNEEVVDFLHRVSSLVVTMSCGYGCCKTKYPRDMVNCQFQRQRNAYSHFYPIDIVAILDACLLKFMTKLYFTIRTVVALYKSKKMIYPLAGDEKLQVEGNIYHWLNCIKILSLKGAQTDYHLSNQVIVQSADVTCFIGRSISYQHRC